MYFYERFEAMVKEKGTNLAEVSRGTKIPYTTIDSIIKNKQKYTSMDNVLKMSKYFGRSMEWIATGKEISRDGKTLEISPLKSNLIDQIVAQIVESCHNLK